MDGGQHAVRVVHVNTFDSKGGAARAAYRLHQGLRRLQQESFMFVADKASDDPFVILYQPRTDLWSRIRREVRRQKFAREIEAYRHTAPGGLGFFADDRSVCGADPWRHLPATDVIQLHWTLGLLDYEAFFAALPRGKPVVLTMHGMDAITGGCFWNGDCQRFAEECGACPQLGSRSESDLSRQNWRRKRRAYSQLQPGQLHVVTPSRWLGEEVKRSSLLGGFPCTVIPNAVDTDVFVPRNRVVARELLGVPPAAKVLLFLADGLHLPRKGWHVLVEALAGIERRDLFVVLLGPGQPSGLDGIPHLRIKPIDNDRILSFVYSAADLFVVPSLQDNLPNTVLESFACGTPAAGFAVGGIPDLIRPGVSGLLAKPRDPHDLRRAILELIGDSERLRSMAGNCRRIACEEYSLEIQARRYETIYREMVERSKGCL